MRNFILILIVAALLPACQSRHASNQAHDRELKAAEEARARKNAEQDAIQAQRQLNLVAERTKSGVQNGPRSSVDAGAPPKR